MQYLPYNTSRNCGSFIRCEIFDTVSRRLSVKLFHGTNFCVLVVPPVAASGAPAALSRRMPRRHQTGEFDADILELVACSHCDRQFPHVPISTFVSQGCCLRTSHRSSPHCCQTITRPCSPIISRTRKLQSSITLYIIKRMHARHIG